MHAKQAYDMHAKFDFGIGTMHVFSHCKPVLFVRLLGARGLDYLSNVLLSGHSDSFSKYEKKLFLYGLLTDLPTCVPVHSLGMTRVFKQARWLKLVN